MQVKSEPLERYVFGMAWFLLVLGVLLLPFPFVAGGAYAERIETYPEFIQKIDFFYYAFFGVIGAICGMFVYPIAYVIPLLVFLARNFKAAREKKKRFGFLLFVLMFFLGITVMLFRTPFNLV